MSFWEAEVNHVMQSLHSANNFNTFEQHTCLPRKYEILFHRNFFVLFHMCLKVTANTW